MRRSKLLVIVGLTLAFAVISGCSSSPEEVAVDFELSESQAFGGLGYSIEYPFGWFADTEGSVSVISQIEEDHERAFQGNFPVQGYQVTLDHRGMAFMRDLGLPGSPSLQDLVELNRDFLDWQEPIEVEDAVLFGAPALSVRRNSRIGWGISIMGFLDQEAFLLNIRAPTEETLDSFIPTWERMLSSIKPEAD